MSDIILSAAGFLVFILLCSEEFRASLKRAWRRAYAFPGGRYLAYPVAALLALAAAGLMLFALWSFISSTFSYD
ncbi:MAG: hypothetical protein QME75_04245 [Deltaproteobacteria bacterium]|nr:hypothetical protein [Deltaproteobacteria bacterium]